jgi:hypothetical protein
VPRPIPTSRGSSSESARAIDLRPEPSLILSVWWVALHCIVLAALAMLGAPGVPKVLAAIAALAHAAVFRPRCAPRLVWRGGRVTVPELGVHDLTLGPRSRHCGLWIRLDLRGAGRTLDVLLLADQLEPETWRTLRAELARVQPATASGDPGRDLR